MKNEIEELTTTSENNDLTLKKTLFELFESDDNYPYIICGDGKITKITIGQRKKELRAMAEEMVEHIMKKEKLENGMLVYFFKEDYFYLGEMIKSVLWDLFEKEKKESEKEF